MISRKQLATSQHPAVRTLRAARRGLYEFSLPFPPAVYRLPVALFLALRSAAWFLRRVFLAEPFFKAHCARCGRNVHTDIHLHWIQGRGDLVVGDHVLVDGMCSITFAARYAERPELVIGDHTGVGDHCTFTVGKSIRIGRHCRIASEVVILDSTGHPSDPEARRQGLPTPEDEVRPVVVGDNVWIGRRAIILPGVTIGEGSVVGAGAVVAGDVPAYTVVAGNPARRIAALKSPAERAETPTGEA